MGAVIACLVLALAGCGAGAPQKAGPSNGTQTAREDRSMSGAVSPAGDKHPGTIVYDDKVEHRTWTENAADVPPTMAWVKVDERWKPVVRIEITGAGDQREMTAYGPDHEFLQSTMARLSAPPPSEPTPTPTPTPTPRKK